MNNEISSRFKSIYTQLLEFEIADRKFTLRQASQCVNLHALWIVRGIYRLIYWCRGKGWINQKKVIDAFQSCEKGLGPISAEMKENKRLIEKLMFGAHYKPGPEPYLSSEEAESLAKISRFAQTFLSIGTQKPLSSSPLYKDLDEILHGSLFISNLLGSSAEAAEKGIQAIQKFSSSSKTLLSKFDISLEQLIVQPIAPVEEEWMALDQLVENELTEKKGYVCDLSQRPICMRKNRYSNILPYNQNFFGNSDGTHYINASLIELGKKTYISTQEPIQETIPDFFTLLIQEGVQVVVCLVNCIKESKNEKLRKTTRYWESQLFPMRLDNGYEVSLIATHRCKTEQIVERTFVFSKEGKEIRRVTQLHYINWPDFEAPDDAIFEVFLKKVFEKHIEGPLLCHCSAGVGRTGTFIAIHSLCTEINEKIHQGKSLKEIYVNFPERIMRMRTFRGKLVQTFEQYQFIKDTVAIFATPLEILQE
ncbi:protein-tyrosine phosphatase family protein [Parachlamydia sp. AcF125]|uniref:protein tyrosine phosphatase family protein n=1 Tax=Parachlamydia sp. AcF125 TaxID=2795736 RepID=UPI001BC97764|nr:protein-tyrosine phosphatase family protein [Parachlamydia sp. AcF125]MBS4168636.1 hypothetical protein [Parachlamydia sp. AcF125]